MSHEKELNINISTPWGDIDSTKGEARFTQLLKVGLAQLKAMRAKGNQSIYLKTDIQGYEELLATKSDDAIEEFFQMKSDAINKGKRFKNNMEVVEEMKRSGKWPQ